MLATAHYTCSIKWKEFTINSWFHVLLCFFSSFLFYLPTDSVLDMVLDILISEYVVSSGVAVAEVVSAQKWKKFYYRSHCLSKKLINILNKHIQEWLTCGLSLCYYELNIRVHYIFFSHLLTETTMTDWEATHRTKIISALSSSCKKMWSWGGVKKSFQISVSNRNDSILDIHSSFIKL